VAYDTTTARLPAKEPTRNFDLERHPEEPAVALRKMGFDFLVEAELWRGNRGFRAPRLQILPISRRDAEIWRAGDDSDEVWSLPPYQRGAECRT
jgi:hypothetical protein